MKSPTGAGYNEHGMDKRFLVSLFLAPLAIACTRTAEDDAAASSVALSGQVTSTLSVSAVAVFALDANGAATGTICQTSVSAWGFTCAVPSDPDSGDAGPVLVVASDPQGNLFHTVVADPVMTGSVVVSALTELSFQRVQALLSQGVLLDDAVAVADTELKLATGLSGGDALGTLVPALPPTDPTVREANARGALEFALVRLAASLRVPPAELIVGLGSDFALDRNFDGTRAGTPVTLRSGVTLPKDIWSRLQTTIGALSTIDRHYGPDYVYPLKLTSAPPPVPAGFEVTGPIISIAAPFSVTWSSGLAASYVVTLCPTPNLTSPSSCSVVSGITGLATDPGALAGLSPGTYYLKVVTDSGRAAANASDSSPYSFRLVGP